MTKITIAHDLPVIAPKTRKASLNLPIQSGVAMDCIQIVQSISPEITALSGCLKTSYAYLNALNRESQTQAQACIPKARCYQNNSQDATPLYDCAHSDFGVGQSLSSERKANQSRQETIGLSSHTKTGNTQTLSKSKNANQSRAIFLSGCLKTPYQRTLPTPCEWYEIKLPEKPAAPPKIGRVCGELPASNRLPLSFRQEAREQDARRLRFTFTCNATHINLPALDTYMILNHITALADDQPLNLFSCRLSADTDGLYWTGDITLPPDDFIRLNLDQRADDCLIHITLNNETFVFLAESYSDNRQFGQRSYTITGRSQTAKLGADYALCHQGIIDQDRNARQIADEALADLGVSLDWQIDDWLVPANVYNKNDKTPIGILSDIAQAAGAFVETHPSELKIAIKPRYRVPAWQLNTAAAAVSVPANMIISISGSKIVNTQHNSVFVWGEHEQGFAADIWREGSNREPRASTQNHILYTAPEVCRMAGIAVLSQSGTHKQETVKLPLAPQYGLNRGELGRIWRFNEPNNAWQGIITSITIDATQNNGAIQITQTLTIDRYLGN